MLKWEQTKVFLKFYETVIESKLKTNEQKLFL